MKLIDTKGKLFGKISVIDIAIVLCVLCLLATFALNLFGKDNAPVSSVNDVKYSAVFKVYNMYEPYTEPFKIGDTLYSSAGTLIGEIVEISQKPAYSKLKLADGTYKDFSDGTLIDYYVTVEGVGSDTDSTIKADGTFSLIPNTDMMVSSKLYYGNAVVLSVEKIN